MAELGVAVVGTGRMGTFHVEAWERTADARLVAVADPDTESARRCVGRRPVRIHAHYEELLQRADVDAVVVAVPSALHADVTLAALDAGKHVLVEKPIATTVPDALRMASAGRTAGRKLMVGHVERFNPAIVKVGELVREGRLGRVYRIQAVRVGPLPQRIRDAGVVMDLATHDADIMQHVLGRDITRVFAQGSQFVHNAQEDLVSCLLRFGDEGPFGLLDVNWLTPEKRRELSIIGERGMVRADYIAQDVDFVESPVTPTTWSALARIRGDAEGTSVRFALRKAEPLRAEIEAFIRCVLDDLPEPVSANEGTRALMSAVAMRESAAANRSVALLEMPRAHPPPPLVAVA